MKIDIYFMPEQKFSKRLEKKSDYFRLIDLMNSLGVLYNNQNEPNKFRPNVDSFKEKETCVIGMADTVGLNSFVFEQLSLYITIFKNLGVKRVLVNNPPNLLLTILNKMPNCSVHNSLPFHSLGIKKINQLQSSMKENIFGQCKAKQTIYRDLIIQYLRNSDKPLVLMFYGNPGIGKTEVAKLMAQKLYGSKKLVREQMSMTAGSSLEYFKATTHNENSFSKKLLNRESNIILLDEFALAPPYIQTSFFQLFDEGKFVDQNYSVDMRRSIIICTSNFQSEAQIYSEINPALLSRFDGFIQFEDFSLEEKQQIAEKLFNDFQKKISKKNLKNIDWAEAYKFIMFDVKNCSNFRQIRRLIEEEFAYELIKNDAFKNATKK